MRYDTSSFGLCQFSEEKVYKVKYFIPSFLEVLITDLTDSTPTLCPITLGSPLFLAHLPFPSIIIPTCKGILSFKDLLLLILKGLLNLLVVPIRYLLYLLLTPPSLVLRYLLVLFHRPYFLYKVPSYVPYVHLALLRHPFCQLYKFVPPFLGESEEFLSSGPYLPF
ncbi:hypothetical protein ThvES_00020740 [Thiovulum sp. ES]|nr:hypothetical protein ThvES_00020740 [Thiovulum sp. ES]